MLTILGIVIGITTVVTVASLLSGLRQGITTFVQVVLLIGNAASYRCP